VTTILNLDVWFVGSYTAEIPIPYGLDEAARRIGVWLRKSNTNLRVKEKGTDFVHLIARIGDGFSGSELNFVIRFEEDRIRFEGWFGAHTWIGAKKKLSIEPGSWSGKYHREIAWNEFLIIKRILEAEQY
jgi:hypothetical protein